MHAQSVRGWLTRIGIEMLRKKSDTGPGATRFPRFECTIAMKIHVFNFETEINAEWKKKKVEHEIENVKEAIILYDCALIDSCRADSGRLERDKR